MDNGTLANNASWHPGVPVIKHYRPRRKANNVTSASRRSSLLILAIDSKILPFYDVLNYEAGQAPWLSSVNGADTFPAAELSLDIDYVLGQMEKSTRDRKLKKEWTLSEYIMHITSIPNASEVQLPLEPAPKDDPPFDLLTDDNIIDEELSEDETPEPQTPPSMVALGLTQDFQAFEACSTSSRDSAAGEMDLGGEGSSDSDDGSAASSTSWERQSSPSAYNPLTTGQTRRLKWMELAPELLYPYEPTPPRATLPIQWPHDERSMHDVVFDLQGYWPPELPNAPLPQAKSPSPLPSLTPSPPPIHTKTLGKRPSPETYESPSKRSRRSYSFNYDNEAGPSRIPYDPPSPSSDSGSDYYSPPPSIRRRGRRPPARSMKKSPSKSSASSRRFKCLFRTCRQSAFSAPKDRNRHMDTHFECRFRCHPCDKPFPREDALKRHAKKPGCKAAYDALKESGVAVCDSYWRTCDLDLLVCPPASDPLFDWYVERVRTEIGEEAAMALLI
ncbi:hypothetical protein BC629DRAFT_1595604 [Irpex lacteus]|nr:hypothetical protein BC629DRAFT_1595604 [Irpex lacteus]